MSSVLKSEKQYRIISKDGLVLDNNGTKITTQKLDKDSESQKWIAHKEAKGYRLETLNQSGDALRVMEADTTSGILQINNFKKESYQLFQTEEIKKGEGEYIIMCAMDALVIRNEGENKQTKCVKFDMTDTAQHWKIVEIP